MKVRTLLCYLIFASVSQSGCMVFEAAELGEAGLATAEGGALAEGVSALTQVEVEELATEGIMADDIALFRNSAGEIRAGRLLSSEEVAFEKEFSRIKVSRNPGENPKLYIDGYTKPFGEVYPEEGRINVYAVNRSFSIRKNIFSVEGERVNVLRDKSGSPDNVVATVYKGDLVIKLAEEDGWYRVKVLKDANAVTGFISAGLLAPLFLGALADSTHADKPYSIIKEEERGRWDHYWSTIDSKVMTGKDALDLLYDEFRDSLFNRQISYSMQDWPLTATRFLKMDYDNIPILNEESFEDSNLQIIGLTRSGELLDYINLVNESVKLNNPLDWGPRNYGTWYQVKTLDGQYGWIFTEPEGQNYSTGYTVERVIPVYQSPVVEQPVQKENASEKKSRSPLKTILIIAGVIVILALLSKAD